MDTLTVRFEKAWGNERFYPLSENAEVIASLMKAKSFTKRDILELKKIFEVEIKMKVEDIGEFKASHTTAVRTDDVMPFQSNLLSTDDWSK